MTGKQSKAKRWSIFIYAVICYAAFQGAFLWLIAFVNDLFFPVTMNQGPSREMGIAIAGNVALVLLFGVQHSVMARRSFKERWTRIIPQAAERPSYVMATNICLLFIFLLWSPMPAVIWHADAANITYAVWGLQALGWATVLAATFALNHFELFGLQQGWCALQGKEIPEQQFRTPFLYRIVRHPIQLGILIAFWATPHMTAGHLLFASTMTAYIFIGLYYEERDLIRHFGQRYIAYKQQVPKVLPIPRLPKSSDEIHPAE